MRVAPRLTAYYIGRAMQGGLTITSQLIVFRLFGSGVFADIGFFALLPTMLAVADQVFVNEIFASIKWSEGACLIRWSRVRQTAALNVAYAIGISVAAALALSLLHLALRQSQACDRCDPAYLLLACSSSALWWSISFWANYAGAIDKPILCQCVGISAPLGRCLVPLGTFLFRVKHSIDTHLYVGNGIAALVLLTVWASYFARGRRDVESPLALTSLLSRQAFTRMWNTVKAQRAILAASISASTYNMVDKVVFWAVLPKAVYGNYLLIYQLIGVVSLFAGPLYSAMVPVLNRVFQSSQGVAFRSLLSKTIFATALALIVISLLCLFNANTLLSLVFKHGAATAFLRLAYGTAVSSYLVTMSTYVPWAVLCFRGEARYGADIFVWTCISLLAIAVILFLLHLTALILPAIMALSVIQAVAIMRRLRLRVWGGQSFGLAFKCYPALMLFLTLTGLVACWQNADWHHL
jgi:O-antigen/teichoic acid export membrane protein